MEKCVFCQWTRKTAPPSIRFFGVPKAPGLRRIQWLYALGKRDLGPRDRVCSAHFRRGRPSNDASHEDFSPHLYLDSEPPPEVLQYLERLAETGPNAEESGANGQQESNDGKFKGSLSLVGSRTLELNKAPRPSILQRKRKMLTIRPSSAATSSNQSDLKEIAIYVPAEGACNDGQTVLTSDRTLQSVPVGRRLKLQILQKPLAEAAGLKPGQTVIIKRRVKHPEVAQT